MVISFCLQCLLHVALLHGHQMRAHAAISLPSTSFMRLSGEFFVSQGRVGMGLFKNFLLFAFYEACSAHLP